ncbi:MAG: LysM peptidoglycan-binding domain-containing protein [Spirosomataceae bacterium]
MNLRTFKITFILISSFLVSVGKGFADSPASSPVPYEVKFADVTFQLNDITRYIVQNHVNALQANKAATQAYLEKLMLYLPIVEPTLKDGQVPNDFKYLMLYNKLQTSIENTSELDSDILWCMDEVKAKDVDLVMNGQLDERKHIMAATKGAVVCLKRNYVLYKNWGSTLFSHIADKKVLNLLEINKKWGSNQYIQLDGAAYSSVLQFLAYKIALEREFSNYRPSVQKIVYEYPYSKNKTLNKISTELKVEPSTLSSYNSWLKVDKVPDSDCNVLVVVPAERYNDVRNLAELTQKSGLPIKDLGFPVLKRNPSFAKNRGGTFYEINGKAGIIADMCDSPIELAYKADISIGKFLEFNEMKETDILKIGQVYYLEKKNSKASVPFHVVREGETLWDIAQMYGVGVNDLLTYNRMDKVQRLQRGRVIYMQNARSKNKPIEYIQSPSELKEIEELVENTNQNSEPKQPEIVNNEVKNKSVEKTISVDEPTATLPKEIDVNSLPLSHEIGKKPDNSSKKPANTSSSLPKELDVNSLPLSHEIGKSPEKNLNSQNNVDNKEVISNVSKKDSKNKKQETEDNETNDEEKSDSKSARYLYHTVKEGETLYRLSVIYNVEVDAIKRLNGLKSNIIEIGDRLKVKKSK